MDHLLDLALVLAGVPAMIGMANLLLVIAPQGRVPDKALVSILIRARNAEADIEACIAHALGQIGVAVEVIALDDGSLDHTGELLGALAAREPRIRVLAAAPPPPGWRRRAFACALLSRAARGTHLLFLDAAVRLDPHAAAALAGQAARLDAAMVSGIPRRHIRSLGAALALPMRNLLAIGYRLGGGRAFSRLPLLAAVSDEVMLVTRTGYERAGGHAAVCNTRREADALARRMRGAGLRTDTVDAAGLASSRPGCGLREAWDVLAGARRAPLPAAWLVAGAHLLPVALLPSPRAALALALMAALRIGVAIRTRETCWAVPLHPAALLLLVAAQILALGRAMLAAGTPRQRQEGPVAGMAGP